MRAQTAPGSILVRRLLRPAGVRERRRAAALQPPAHLQRDASAGTIVRGAVSSVSPQLQLLLSPNSPPWSTFPSNMPDSEQKTVSYNLCSRTELSAQSIHLVLIVEEINSVHQCTLVISTSLIKAFVSIKTLVKMFL